MERYSWLSQGDKQNPEKIRRSDLSLPKARSKSIVSDDYALSPEREDSVTLLEEHKSGKTRSKTSRFKKWLQRTFCGQTTAHTTDVRRESCVAGLSTNSWK